jgi:hypothetical protein
MCDNPRRHFLHMSMLAIGAASLAGAAFAAEPAADPKKPKLYVCPPCGCDNDGKDFPAPGPCTACGMPLIEKPEPAPAPKG